MLFSDARIVIKQLITTTKGELRLINQLYVFSNKKIQRREWLVKQNINYFKNGYLPVTGSNSVLELSIFGNRIFWIYTDEYYCSFILFKFSNSFLCNRDCSIYIVHSQYVYNY